MRLEMQRGVCNVTNWIEATKTNLSKLDCDRFYLEHNSKLRMTGQQRSQLAAGLAGNQSDILRKVRDYCQRYAKSASNVAFEVGMQCNLSESIVRKVFKAEKAMTADFLGHICVGLELSMEESEELFALFGRPLVFGKSYFESVTMVAIKDKDDIDAYEQDLNYFRERLKVPRKK